METKKELIFMLVHLILIGIMLVISLVTLLPFYPLKFILPSVYGVIREFHRSLLRPEIDRFYEYKEFIDKW